MLLTGARRPPRSPRRDGAWSPALKLLHVIAHGLDRPLNHQAAVE
jgi:hypothetical protein